MAMEMKQDVTALAAVSVITPQEHADVSRAFMAPSVNIRPLFSE
jgi:hypothetical protein